MGLLIELEEEKLNQKPLDYINIIQLNNFNEDRFIYIYIYFFKLICYV